MKLGERRSLRIIYIRWTIIFTLLCVIGGLAVARYDREVSTLSPEQLMEHPPKHRIRVLGRVMPGTLHQETHEATFRLSGETDGGTPINVQYRGRPDDNLRELKIMVVEGTWDEGRVELSADRLSLPPNYGFVTAAYLLSLIPLVLFLFNMERNVILLSIAIKEAKGYEPQSAASSSGAGLNTRLRSDDTR